jgi:uroporphyrinogen-III decarboxylase
MNHREYTQLALAHQPSTHVPYTINLTVEGYQAYGDALLERYATAEILADFQSSRVTKEEAVSLAIGNFMFCTACPWWNWHNLSQEYLTSPTPPNEMPHTIGSGSYEAFFEKVRYVREKYGRYILITIWGSHWEKAYFSRGIENFLSDLAGSPEFAQRLLDEIIRKNMVMLENIVTCADIDGILLGSDWGTQANLIMSPRTWRKMIAPGEQKEYDLLKRYAKDVFVHSCGDIRKIMPDLVEMGVDGLNPVQPECMDLAELKEKYGQRITFWGGISTQRTLPYGTPADVEREAAATIQLMSQSGGYITSPSQEIQTDVPYDNLIALIETAKRYA